MQALYEIDRLCTSIGSNLEVISSPGMQHTQAVRVDEAQMYARASVGVFELHPLRRHSFI